MKLSRRKVFDVVLQFRREVVASDDVRGPPYDRRWIGMTPATTYFNAARFI
jgi:hypothetical protein